MAVEVTITTRSFICIFNISQACNNLLTIATWRSIQKAVGAEAARYFYVKGSRSERFRTRNLGSV